jgi:hypothetical protein
LGTTAGYEGWFQELATTLRFSKFLHEKLEKEWTVQQVPNRARYMALASLYEGAALTRMGESLCEVALNNGPLLAPSEVLTQAEAALSRALTQLAALPGGDVAVPYGVATSAKNTAYGLRAQARWMKGDLTGAAADAALVPNGFTTWVTRDANAARNNKAHFAGTLNRYAELYDVVNWWLPANRTNPVTGQPWPQIIPFTGYVFLGIMPDGRAVRDDGLPIRTTYSQTWPTARTAVPGIEPTAVTDTRVRFYFGQVGGAGGAAARPIHQKYAAADSDIPLVNWREMILSRAEAAGGQAAIDLVNQIRAADNLPPVTYLTGATASPQQIKYMIIEERRRALFLEGRFLMTKLKNLDLLWFPRAQGQTPGAGRSLGGGVRFHMPDDEFLYNPNLNGDLNLRGTKCAQHERPIIQI